MLSWCYFPFSMHWQTLVFALTYSGYNMHAVTRVFKTDMVD